MKENLYFEKISFKSWLIILMAVCIFLKLVNLFISSCVIFLA